MASLISVLSLLVLSIGCFALPVVQNNLIDSSSTLSSSVDSIIDHASTHEMTSFTMQLLSEKEKSQIPKLPLKETSSNKHDSQTSNLSNNQKTLENISRASRAFNGLQTAAAFLSRREEKIDEHNTDHLSLTTPINEKNKQNILEVTTISMPSFTSTSSSVAPELYTPQSLLTTTEKYIGHLKDETEKEDVKKDEKKISEKDQELKKLPTKSEDILEDQGITAIAPVDPQASGQIPNVPGSNMFLEQNTNVVTNIPDISIITTTTTIKNEEEKKQEDESKSKPLNQGEEPSHTEEKKSGHWNGSSFR